MTISIFITNWFGIILLILCLGRGCGEISVWINSAEPMKNHRKSNVLNTSSYQCDNDNLLAKHTLLYHIALTTRNENSFQVATCVPSETTKVRKRVDSASHSQEGTRMSDENQVGISWVFRCDNSVLCLNIHERGPPLTTW